MTVAARRAHAGGERHRVAVGGEQVRPKPPERRVERLCTLLEELDDRGVEAHGHRPGDLEHETRPRGGSSPRLARPIAVPRAIHPQVRPDLEPAIEPDQEVLPESLDRRDLAPDDPAPPAGLVRVRRCGRP